MAPSKAPNAWDDEDSDSTPPSSPPVIARRGKFDDEEDDSDVVESWDAAEDSEAEREKAKKAAEAKAKADAEAKANHKSRAQRIEEKRQENLRRRAAMEEESSDEEEDEADKRARLRESEKLSDLANAEDLFSGIGISKNRGAAKPVTIQEGEDPASAIDLSKLQLFNPTTLQQFTQLRETLVPLFNANGKKPQYASFLQELTKQIVRDLNSEQVKKIASGLTTISNEKLKDEKAADKGGKKTKAAKTKTTLSAGRDISSKADITSYDDGLAE
jgi:translation initiation factor 3 subunit J